MNETRYDGLVLVASTGVAWFWTGFRWIPNRAGDKAYRMECFESYCRACAQPFTVQALIPEALIARYEIQRIGTKRDAEVCMRVPAEHRIGNFTLRNCPDHREISGPDVVIIPAHELV